MSNKVFRETLEGAVRLDGWLANKAKPIIPRVVAPDCGDWILGVDDLADRISWPALVLINIGLTALPESLQGEIVRFASRENLVVWAHIRTSDNDKIRRAFIRQVGDSRVEKYIEAIPGLQEALI